MDPDEAAAERRFLQPINPDPVTALAKHPPPAPPEDEVEHYTEQITYWWRCGKCGDVHDSEFDSRGQIINCPTCGTEARLTGDY